MCMKNKGQFSGVGFLCKFWGLISNYKEKRIYLSIASKMEVKGAVIVILNTGNILLNDFSYSTITIMLNKSIFFITR